MADWQQQIQYGQGVWDEHRNGFITGVDYSMKTVRVEYTLRDGLAYSKYYEWNDLEGNWDDKLQQWVLVPA